MASDNIFLAREFSLTHPEPAAQVLRGLPRAEGTAFLSKLPIEGAAGVLSVMLPTDAATHLADMAKDRITAILQEFAPQGAADIIRLLPESMRPGLIGGQNAVRRPQILFYLRQTRGNTGAWVESDVVVARPDEPAKDVQERCSRYRGKIPTVYVVDPAQAVVGEISILSLIAAGPAVSMSQLMEPVPGSLRAGTPLELAVAHTSWRGNDALPVVGADGRFLGAARFSVLRHAADDAVDEHPPEMFGDGLTALADAWFVGLSDILGASVGRRAGPAEGIWQDGSPR